MMGGWFRVWMTGKGSSVGPGIIRISRVWGMAHLIGSALAGLMGSMSFRRRRLRPGLGEQAVLAPDEIEVAKVDEETGALPQDEHGVAAVNCVDEQNGAATDGEEPEGDGNDALPPRSEAIHCTRKRLKKKPCPRNPMESQNCSLVMISASLDSRLLLPRKAFAGQTSRRPPYRRRKDAARIFRMLHRFRGSGNYREDERTVRACHRVHASGRPPGIVAGAAHPRIVGHGALEYPDLLVAEMAMARHRGARRVPHEHGLVSSVRVLPQRLPEDAGASLDPRGLLDVGEEAHGRAGHNDLDLLCGLGSARALERIAD